MTARRATVITILEQETADDYLVLTKEAIMEQVESKMHDEDLGVEVKAVKVILEEFHNGVWVLVED